MCLPDGKDAERAVFGPDGVLTAAVPRTVVCDHSTIHPRDARALTVPLGRRYA